MWEQDKEFDELVKHRVELSERIVRVKETIDSPTKQLLDEYLDVVESVNSRQTEFLYLQGVKDCFRLLKTLGVI